MNAQIKNRIKGVIFGQAVGDALGLGTEFLTKRQVSEYYPNGLQHYDEIVRDSHRSRWAPASWTDDTDQFLCILDSLIENQSVNELDVARSFKHWLDTNGMGVGKTTYSVLTLPQYEQFPKKGAELIWKMRKRDIAPNGGIMRNGIVGTFRYWDIDAVVSNSRNICALTHFDPRCQDSCEIMSTLIVGELTSKPISWATLQRKLSGYDERILPYIVTPSIDVEDLKLDDSKSLGYTLKALNAAIWSYFNASSFEKGLKDIIMQGGDADTNGCVAGCVLGAKFGYDGIPKTWIDGLKDSELLENKTEEYIDLLKILNNVDH